MTLYQHLTNEQIVKLIMSKMTLEHFLCFLGLNKHHIKLTDKENILLVKKHIEFFLSPNQTEKPTSPVQEQLLEYFVQLQQPQSLKGQINPLMQLI